MASKIDFNDNVPAAPASRVNIKWQYDANGNVSANIPTPSASGISAIQDEGTSLPSRTTINFVGSGVTATDDSANNRTVVTISSGGMNQTPWLSDINGNQKSLGNVREIGILFDTDVARLGIHQYKNNGGTSNVFEIIDDRGFGGVNSGNVLYVQAWNAGGDDTGKLFSFNTFAGSGDVPVLVGTLAGNVGIGTSAPSSPLQVHGMIYSSLNGYKFPDGTVQVTAAITSGGPGSGQTPWVSDIDGDNHDLIDVKRIGIGTTSPTSSLDIQKFNASGVGPELILRNQGAAAGEEARISFWGGGTARASIHQSLDAASGYGGQIDIKLGLNSDANALTSVAQFRSSQVTFAQNVGIGTASPSDLLTVSADLNSFIKIESRSTASAGAIIKYKRNTTGAAREYWTGLGTWGGDEWSVYDFTASSMRFFIHGNGSVGIGTAAPGYKLDVAGDHNISGSYRVRGVPVTYNVISYGAVGDGVTDDTVAIQAAVNAAIGAGGGTVFFPGGRTYLISSTIYIRAANISLMGFGANILCNTNGINIFRHDDNGGAQSNFRVKGFRFFTQSATRPNNIVGIGVIGESDGSPVPHNITIKDCAFENIQWSIYIDKCDDVVIENIQMFGDSQIFAGSTTDTGAQAYSHRVIVQNVNYYPPGGNPVFVATEGGMDGAWIVFKRVGGGAIKNVFGQFRGNTDGIHLLNDTQGVFVDGLVIGCKHGVRMFPTNMGSGSVPPLNNTIFGLQVDMYGIIGIQVAAGCLDTRIKNCVLTGYNTALGTEAHAILSESSGDTAIENNWFQNLKRGNGIYINTGASNHKVTDNYFADNNLNGWGIQLATGITRTLVAQNFKSSADASPNWILNSSGAGVTVTRNYPTD